MKSRDKHIAKKIKQGDIHSFEELFHQYYPGMLLYARCIVKIPGPAEEIVQDVFYNIWKNRENFLLNASWKSYLYRAVYNNSMFYLRKARRELRMDDAGLPETESHIPGPSEEMDYTELKETISETLENLPLRTRQIFTLSRFEGLTYSEIAKKLSISVKTVEANMGKALKAFRLSLGEYGNYKN